MKQNKTKIFLIFFGAIFVSQLIFSSYISGNIGLEWTRYYGGDGNDVLHASITTSDNCTLLVGESGSFTDDSHDVYIVKVDSEGNLVWNTTFGVTSISGDDAGYSVIEVEDGYLVTGKICHPDGIGDDLLLLKLTHNGAIWWYKHFGGNAWDWGTDLIEVDDGIMIIGSTQDFWGSYYNVYLIKTSKSGNMQWTKKIKHSGVQYASKIVKTDNGGFLILGTTEDSSGLESDIFLLKLDEKGEEIWYKTYGGSGKQRGVDITQVDQNYLIIGETDTKGSKDVYLIKVDKEGNFLWDKTIGSDSDELGQSISYHAGKIVCIANTFETEGTSIDPLLLILNTDGSITFNQTYGTDKYDKGINTHQINEETFLISGYTGSKHPDIFLKKITLKTVQLTIRSSIGEAYGSGTYYIGSKPVLEVENEVVYIDSNTRYIFTGWTSKSPGGYNGNENPIQLPIENNIIQKANWRKQHYIEIPEETYTPDGIKGWFDEGTILTFDNLTFESDGEKWSGTVTYNVKSNPEIQVSPNTYQINEKERYIFQRWTRGTPETHQNYVNNQYSININNITYTADWQKQFYVTIDPEKGGTALPNSGWYNENNIINIRNTPNSGYIFDRWKGTGHGSYSGKDTSTSIIVKGPITQKTVFRKLCKVSIDSEFNCDGTGEYPENSTVTVMAPKSRGGLIKKEFKKWTGDIQSKDNPLSFQIHEDTELKAIYTVNYIPLLISGLITSGGITGAGYILYIKKTEREKRTQTNTNTRGKLFQRIRVSKRSD